ncbi:DUF2059 domain-containing protein [Paracoccus aminophilus]|uniref:DUF2059 domain-containing protein n=1 Tax=Paracoccus aminophilus JCM 7686 TaxID=1367847 RepID=S5XLP0_PARAH|nr:DUF2059 domain-containing protein [Paracoccus aminophilus]AGT08134.1 hypothetical protein JCM7686_1025 [Paracoccus aminophilus JCM 7686]
MFRLIRTAPLVALLVAFSVPVSSPAQEAGAHVVSPADQTLAHEIYRVLHLDEVVGVMAEEAIAGAAPEDSNQMSAEEQRAWLETLRRVNAPDKMRRLMQERLAETVGQADPALIRRALLFYSTPFGKRVIGLEISARSAMLAPGAEEAAREAARQATLADTPRAAKIQTIISSGGLVDRNVVSSLNSVIATHRGFTDGAGEGREDDAATADAWAQEGEIRADVADWLTGLLFLAYGPLDDAELAQIASFVGSPEGRELMDVLDKAYDGMFEQMSYEAGFLAAGQIAGAEL